jgi:hypothetical protein
MVWRTFSSVFGYMSWDDGNGAMWNKLNSFNEVQFCTPDDALVVQNI